MDDIKNQKIDIIMKDYEILKTYSTITSPSIRYNLISIFFATIGIIFSGTIFALSSGIEKLYIEVAVIITFLWGFFIPAFSLCILYIWLGEEQRMIRIGKFCKEKEDLINLYFKEEILNWETYKRKYSIIYPEFLIIGMLFGLSLGSSVAAIYLSYKILSYLSLLNFIIFIILDILIHLVIAYLTFRFIKKYILYN